MKVMVIVKASKASEAGVMPPTEMFSAMRKFNEELLNAGILLGAAGLTPSSRGARVRVSGSNRTVIDGHSLRRRNSSPDSRSGRSLHYKKRLTG